MREALFILLVLAVLAALTAYRYRRGIGAFVEFWRMIRSAQQKGQPSDKQIKEEPTTAGPLVHCPKCGKWLPESEAIRLGRTSYYCSTKCLEVSTKAV